MMSIYEGFDPSQVPEPFGDRQDPNHTGTSRSGDLVAVMKDQIESWEFEDPRETWWKWQHQYAQAADRIEALEAENERLEALFTNATYEARAMMEEIERLRAELSGWREMAGKAEQ